MNQFKIIEKLCEAGFPTYLVGGAVRDEFSGITPKDFDISTKATPDEIAEVFKGHRVNLVGKNFGVTLVDGFEVATFRFDQYPDQNGAKNCVVQYAENIHDDLARRDLTINSLALCVISGELIDNFGGLHDLKHNIIKFVGNADERIAEDPCRILRACRFLAKIQGSFDPETLAALQRNAYKVNFIDVERVQKEIFKALECDFPSIFFNALHLIDALDFVFPGISSCVGHTHGNHHIEDVWEHSLLAGDSISKRHPLVRLAGFLHDVGKPQAFNEVDGSFINHEHIGAKIVNGWLKNLKFSNHDRETVSNLVYTHMLGAAPGATPKATRKFLRTLNDLNVNPSDWLRVRIADRKSNLNKEPFTFGDIKYRRGVFNFVEQPVFDVNSLALKGGELISLFNIKPGPIVGRLQKHLLEYVIEEGFEKNNPEDLFNEGKKYLDTTSNF